MVKGQQDKTSATEPWSPSEIDQSIGSMETKVQRGGYSEAP
jgi:hypothetical protein